MRFMLMSELNEIIGNFVNNIDNWMITLQKEILLNTSSCNLCQIIDEIDDVVDLKKICGKRQCTITLKLKDSKSDLVIKRNISKFRFLYDEEEEN